MQRYDRKIADPHLGPPRRAGRWAGLLAAALLAAPLLADGAKLSYAQWMALFGPKPAVATPAIDLVESQAVRMSQEMRRVSRSYMKRLPWPVEWAVGLLVFSMAGGSLMLKYGRAR